MTDSEMQETEGAVAPWVAGAGLGAAAGGGLTVGANAWRFNSFALNSGVNKAWRR